jgi:hypothetical protein
MYIKEITYQSDNYLKLVSECGTVFNLPEWLDMYETNILVHGILNANNDLIGTFFYLPVQKWD